MGHALLAASVYATFSQTLAFFINDGTFPRHFDLSDASSHRHTTLDIFPLTHSPYFTHLYRSPVQFPFILTNHFCSHSIALNYLNVLQLTLLPLSCHFPNRTILSACKISNSKPYPTSSHETYMIFIANKNGGRILPHNTTMASQFRLLNRYHMSSLNSNIDTKSQVLILNFTPQSTQRHRPYLSSLCSALLSSLTMFHRHKSSPLWFKEGVGRRCIRCGGGVLTTFGMEAGIVEKDVFRMGCNV